MRPQNTNDKPPPPQRDYRAEVTDQVVKLLESGTSKTSSASSTSPAHT
jgi:hypothetical protein